MNDQAGTLPVPGADESCRTRDPEEQRFWDKVIGQFADYCRSRSLFILHYCTGCGAIELPPTITSRFDMERVGIQPMVTPRQADILLITGYLSVKTLKRVILSYEQMQAPKYVIGLGSCTINGGMYWNSYATIKRLDEYIPVDMFIAGCMPRPEAVQQVFLKLAETIDKGEACAWQDYYRNYDRYLGNQMAIFGDDWHTPTDVIGEARHYGYLSDGTTGDNTQKLERHDEWVLDPVREPYPHLGRNERERP